MITGYETFNYVGYTEGGNKPTFYFDEGHYTQVHDIAANVGWHSIPRDILCTRININKSAVDLIMEITENEKEREQNFAERILSGKYTDNVTGTLCEIFMDKKGTCLGLHISRSRLVSATEPGAKYNEETAKEVLRNGSLADNEKR